MSAIKCGDRVRRSDGHYDDREFVVRDASNGYLSVGIPTGSGIVMLAPAGAFEIVRSASEEARAQDLAWDRMRRSGTARVHE